MRAPGGTPRRYRVAPNVCVIMYDTIVDYRVPAAGQWYLRDTTAHLADGTETEKAWIVQPIRGAVRKKMWGRAPRGVLMQEELEKMTCW